MEKQIHNIHDAVYEPIVAHGPFVMGSHEEIQQAIADYRSGKLGNLEL